MNQAGQAKVITEGDLLDHIARTIKQGYFDEWQSAGTVEDREAIHSKQGALDQVLFEIKEEAKKVINNG